MGVKEVQGKKSGCEPRVLRECQCAVHCIFVGSMIKQTAYG